MSSSLRLLSYLMHRREEETSSDPSSESPISFCCQFTCSENSCDTMRFVSPFCSRTLAHSCFASLTLCYVQSSCAFSAVASDVASSHKCEVPGDAPAHSYVCLHNKRHAAANHCCLNGGHDDRVQRRLQCRVTLRLCDVFSA